ncbi:glycosyltransferase [Paractinoplanes toevensis]|uniref:Glycosyl transferase n=1 Tax=Paractinoplanes toevensis TaxID=571911 RepID=A0A919W6E8_9ACTN|nr:glycosyltransferase [Actinoplanes toevensis]GIM94535.1 glycosyl transferase [Actinoplanes toevensis]
MTPSPALAWLALLPCLALTAHTAVNATLLRRLPRPDQSEISGKRRDDSRVSVLLPLRDEAGRVGPCLEALLAQRGVPELAIHVLDDGSTDGTADVVTAIAGDRVQLIKGAELPEGWLGKPHACHQLAQVTKNADILAFVDADVVLEPHAIAEATALMRGIGVDLLSPYPKIVGAGSGLLQPLLQWSWLTFLPLRAMERSPRPSLAAAGGQWLMIDAESYRRAGGHAAVRTEILEDIALARQVKRSGGRIALADATGAATCRMYDSWPEMINGYTKSLWASFGSPVAAGCVVVLLLFLYVVPPVAALVLAVTGFGVPALVASAAYLLGVLGRVITAAATGGKAWAAIAHPVSIVLFTWLVARSFRLRRAGRLTWRGRAV